MNKELIVFSIPTVDGKITAALHMFIRACEKQSDNPRIPWRFQTNIIEGYKPTEYARNRLVQVFLQDPEASRLWFLDADVKPPREAAEMLRIQSDIVAGVYPVWGSKLGEESFLRWTAYRKAPDGRFEYMNIDGKAEPFYADGAATGCMIISRRVLADRRMWDEDKFTHHLTGQEMMLSDEDPPAIFKWPRYPNGKTMCTDDFYFCRNAKELGYTLKIHPGVRCGHVKSLDLMQVEQYRESGVKEALERAAA